MVALLEVLNLIRISYDYLLYLLFTFTALLINVV